jgi:Leu/Phe-tRNA-protein transferase
MPDPEHADEDGIAGIGADLLPGTVLAAYRAGLFPMPLGGRRRPGPLGWWSPDPRGIIPLDGLRMSRSLRRSCARYEVRIDTAFEAVIDACAEPNRPGGWITSEIRNAYVALHRLGWAHSIETWTRPGDGTDRGAAPPEPRGENRPRSSEMGDSHGPRSSEMGDSHGPRSSETSSGHGPTVRRIGPGGNDRTASEPHDAGGSLVGGLYGVAIGGLFAGESMFHTATDASKVALVALVELLRSDGSDGAGRLLDVQWVTHHLATLGAVEVPRVAYLERLARALPLPLPRQLLATSPRT